MASVCIRSLPTRSPRRLARSAIQPPPSRFTASTRIRSSDQALYPTRGGGWLADSDAASRRGSFTVLSDAYRPLESMRDAPPQLLQARIAPAAGSVELVPHRILDVEILVIVFSRPELPGRHDGRDDVVPERFRFRERPLGGLRKTFLLFGVIEDRRAVLAADVTELPLAHGGIDVFQEHFEEFFVVHLFRIVDDLNDLRMARGPRGHFLVAGILLGSPHIAGGRGDDARKGVVRRLHAPEAAARKRGYCCLSGGERLGRAGDCMGEEGGGEQAAQVTHVRFLRGSVRCAADLGRGPNSAYC